jgi:hypothetical protein
MEQLKSPFAMMIFGEYLLTALFFYSHFSGRVEKNGLEMPHNMIKELENLHIKNFILTIARYLKMKRFLESVSFCSKKKIWSSEKNFLTFSFVSFNKNSNLV